MSEFSDFVSDFNSNLEAKRKLSYEILKYPRWLPDKEEGMNLISLEIGLGVKFKLNYLNIFKLIRDGLCAYKRLYSILQYFGDYIKPPNVDWKFWLVGGYSDFDKVYCGDLKKFFFFNAKQYPDILYMCKRELFMGGFMVDDPFNYLIEIPKKYTPICLRPFKVEDDGLVFYLTREDSYKLDAGFVYWLVITGFRIDDNLPIPMFFPGVSNMVGYVHDSMRITGNAHYEGILKGKGI